MQVVYISKTQFSRCGLSESIWNNRDVDGEIITFSEAPQKCLQPIPTKKRVDFDPFCYYLSIIFLPFTM